MVEGFRVEGFRVAGFRVQGRREGWGSGLALEFRV